MGIKIIEKNRVYYFWTKRGEKGLKRAKQDKNLINPEEDKKGEKKKRKNIN